VLKQLTIIKPNCPEQELFSPIGALAQDYRQANQTITHSEIDLCLEADGGGSRSGVVYGSRKALDPFSGVWDEVSDRGEGSKNKQSGLRIELSLEEGLETNWNLRCKVGQNAQLHYTAGVLLVL